MDSRTRHAFILALAGMLLGNCFLVQATPALAAWSNFAGDPQHTAVSAVASQPLEVIHWSTPVDLAPPSDPILIHYGSPLVTPANTIIVPVKTGNTGGFKVEARNGSNGGLIWSQTTDYILPLHNWTPSYSPALTPGNRVYFAGAGGTVYFRDNVDSSGSTGGQLAFFGLVNYMANAASFNATVFVDTPITPDSAGNIYFGFRTSGAAPLGLQSGIARIDSNGNGTWISAVNASGGDANITRVPHQAAPALSNDGQTLYVVVTSADTSTNQYLVGLNPTTLALEQSSPGVPMRVALKDPRNGGLNNATVSDDSSASPMVGPDGDVYYGVLGNPDNGSRGWMLHFSGDLTQTKTAGAFGWDNTPSVVPASMVPSYTGTSSYLIFTKYNNYAGADGGDGVNRIAVLDPNATMVEPHASSNGLLVMKEILTIAGLTPDPEFIAQYPNAVREWCINTAVVDPATMSVMVNSEDGKLYRWNLSTNTLSQVVTLSPGVGEAYTPTLMGPDGTVYAINWAILNAVGRGAASLSINNITVTEGNTGTTPAVFTVTLSTASNQTVTVNYATADGTATAGSDYSATAGTLTFTPGTTSQTITVAVLGDTRTEANETFFVNLSTPSNATIADGRGQGTILNDDALPALSINNVTVTEGNTGTTPAVFTVTLSAASGQTVTVNYATADGKATAGSDYTATAGTLTFTPGATSQTITVAVLGDTVKEPTETFFVNLSNATNATIASGRGRGSILDNDKK
jgi:Calx-beta domain